MTAADEEFDDNVVAMFGKLVVTEEAGRFAAHVSGRQVVIASAPPVACDTCPWRLRNHASPPLHKNHRTPAPFYTPEARAAMWHQWKENGAGISGGYRPGCHLTPPGEGDIQWCAGGDSILQREVLRWWVAGRSRHSFGALTGLEAIHQVLAGILGVFIGFDSNGRIADNRIDLGAGTADVVEPLLDGEPLTLEHVAYLAHPGVADLSVGCEAADLPADDEIATWAKLQLGGGWRTGPARQTIVGITR